MRRDLSGDELRRAAKEGTDVCEFVDCDIDGFGHVCANVFARAALTIDFPLGRRVQIVWIEADDCALDILNGERLLQLGCESQSHADVKEACRWQALGGLYVR